MNKIVVDLFKEGWRVSRKIDKLGYKRKGNPFFVLENEQVESSKMTDLWTQPFRKMRESPSNKKEVRWKRFHFRLRKNDENFFFFWQMEDFLDSQFKSLRLLKVGFDVMHTWRDFLVAPESRKKLERGAILLCKTENNNFDEIDFRRNMKQLKRKVEKVIHNFYSTGITSSPSLDITLIFKYVRENFQLSV